MTISWILTFYSFFSTFHCLLSVTRTWTLMVVTAVRYELVPLSQAQNKVTELSHLIQEVCVVKHGCIFAGDE